MFSHKGTDIWKDFGPHSSYIMYLCQHMEDEEEEQEQEQEQEQEPQQDTKGEK